MLEENITITDLKEYRGFMYDDGNIGLFYNFPQKISIVSSVIRIGSVQVINSSNICNITRDYDIVHVNMCDGTFIQMKLESNM